jgi:hypothetical protein
LTAPTPYMPGLTILTLCTLRHTARLLVLTSTSSFSISSENDETVNANSGHVSWLLVIMKEFLVWTPPELSLAKNLDPGGGPVGQTLL